MSLKIVLPFSLVACGSAATASAGVYANTSGSDKGLDQNHKFKKPDNQSPAPEKGEQQKKEQSTEVETPVEDKDSSQVNKGSEDSVQPLDKSQSSQDEETVDGESKGPKNPNPADNKDRDQKNNPSGVDPEHSLSEKQSLEQKGTETPPTPGESNQTEEPTDVTKQGKERGVENPSQRPGGAPDLQPETEGGAGNKGVGAEDDGADTSGGSTGETSAPPKGEDSSEETDQTTENPSS